MSDRFYQVRDPFNRRAFRASLPEQGDPWTNAWLRAENLPSHTVRVEHFAGSESPQQCIWTTSQALVVHVSVTESLRVSKLTGWTTYKVRVETSRPEREDYAGLAITGRCGELDYTQGEWVFRDTPAGRKRLLRGLAFNEVEWDGSDFFCPSSPGLLKVFCTEDARAALGRHGNVEFTRMNEVEIEELALPSGVRLP